MENHKENEMLTQFNEATFAALCENEGQMEHEIRHLKDELKFRLGVVHENAQLRDKMKAFLYNLEENKFLKNELKELKKDLNVKTVFSETWKKQQEDYLKLKKQMELVTKDRELLSKELEHYKHKCLALRKKSKDVEVTLSEEKEKLKVRVHVLEMEVEKLQKENSTLKDNAMIAKSHRGEIVQKDRELLKEKKRCCDLEEQVEKMTKEQEASETPKIVVQVHQVSEYQVTKEFERNMELSDKLMTTKQQLVKTKRQLEKKDQVIEEKQKECEDLKHSMSRLLPPERLEEIPKCKWTIRDQSKKIQALTGAMNMYQSKAEEYKKEKEILADKAENNKKLYLLERMKNLDLREALKKSGVKQPGKNKAGVTELPSIFSEQELKEQDKTRKTSTIQLPPISSSFKLQAEAKSVHTRTKKIVYLSTQKSDQTPANENIQRKSKGKLHHICLPPISTKPQAKQNDDTTAFMTESGH
uniref:Uncharacterized protein n=1 Tax=Anabas testudineus TaxID=64144 RepID=A0AAQ6IP43_ANATE